jgi:hypothetical protein
VVFCITGSNKSTTRDNSSAEAFALAVIGNCKFNIFIMKEINVPSGKQIMVPVARWVLCLLDVKE